MNMNIKNMKQNLLITLAILILILFMFSGDILLKINESVLGKIFFTILIILYAHENTMYGLFIAFLTNCDIREKSDGMERLRLPCKKRTFCRI